MTDVSQIDIHELLPQQPPFVMVDRLIHFDDRTTSSAFMVKAGNIFVEDGCLNACAIAENIAQTCAARLGYIDKYILKRGIKIGMIGAIRGMKVIATPKVGDELLTEIEIVEEIMGLTLLNATVKVGDELMATAQMKMAEAAGGLP